LVYKHQLLISQYAASELLAIGTDRLNLQRTVSLWSLLRGSFLSNSELGIGFGERGVAWRRNRSGGSAKLGRLRRRFEELVLEELDWDESMV
jgi:hypothetical protein